MHSDIVFVRPPSGFSDILSPLLKIAWWPSSRKEMSS